jgi:hypothetical protein
MASLDGGPSDLFSATGQVRVDDVGSPPSLLKKLTKKEIAQGEATFEDGVPKSMSLNTVDLPLFGKPKGPNQFHFEQLEDGSKLYVGPGVEGVERQAVIETPEGSLLMTDNDQFSIDKLVDVSKKLHNDTYGYMQTT